MVAREIACRREPDPRVVPEYAERLYRECLNRPQLWDVSDWRSWAIWAAVVALAVFLAWLWWKLAKGPKE